MIRRWVGLAVMGIVAASCTTSLGISASRTTSPGNATTTTVWSPSARFKTGTNAAACNALYGTYGPPRLAYWSKQEVDYLVAYLSKATDPGLRAGAATLNGLLKVNDQVGIGNEVGTLANLCQFPTIPT